jgi:hypothetical protein
MRFVVHIVTIEQLLFDMSAGMLDILCQQLLRFRSTQARSAHTIEAAWIR